MTEAEWLTATDPGPMLTLLTERASVRKVRLFACACCRRAHDWIAMALDERQDHYRRAIEVSEAYADGGATLDELIGAFYDADDSAFANSEPGVDPFRDVASEDSAEVADTWWKVLAIMQGTAADGPPCPVSPCWPTPWRK